MPYATEFVIFFRSTFLKLDLETMIVSCQWIVLKLRSEALKTAGGRGFENQFAKNGSEKAPKTEVKKLHE